MNILLIIPVASDLRRVKRQSEESASKGPAASAEGEAESEAEAPPKSEGVSLGKILGLVFLACCILYCIGISWKVYKVCKGTYVEEELSEGACNCYTDTNDLYCILYRQL